MILQSILKPDHDTCSEAKMYWHREGKKFIFDSYFNMFILHKWKEYTYVRTFFLTLQMKGSAKIEIFDQNGLLSSRVYSCGNGLRISIPINYIPTSECIYFSYEPIDAKSDIIDGAYTTNMEPVHQVHLAADICTFKREQYLKHNLEILKKQLLENPDSPVYDHFDIFVVDNGRTLKKEEIEHEHIFMFPNMNAGGTGGFTRGLIEINKRKDLKGYTHMIFMDDDAVLCPDSIVRTFALLSYVSAKWEKAAIAGAHLREDMKYIQHEYGSTWDGMDCHTRYPALDLRVRENVIMNEALDETDYAPWWYACYPLSEAGLDNLPIPIFIHNDDTEYGLRHKKNGFILLNGICVWSPGFENKRSSTLNYYDIRNGMLTNALYTIDGNLGKMKTFCRKRILSNALRYRYNDSELVVKAVEDFLKGPEYLGTLNPEELNTELAKMGYAMKPVEEITDDENAIREVKEYVVPENIEETYTGNKHTDKWKYAMTLNGWMFPADQKKVYALPLGAYPTELYRKGKVVLFDPDNSKGIYSEKSYKDLMRNIGYYLKVAKMLNKGYRQACAAYKKQLPWLTSYDCWKNYLKLEDDE